MIEFRTEGDLFSCGAHAIVNTVNTVGTMGKGLALQFKKRYPQMDRFYVEACRNKEVITGQMWMWKERRLDSMLFDDGTEGLEPEWIINFPTKQHWMNPSRIEWIDKGLDDLKLRVTLNGIRSVGIPALGCNLGGLDFEDVKALVYSKLDTMSIPIYLFAPQEQWKKS